MTKNIYNIYKFLVCYLEKVMRRRKIIVRKAVSNVIYSNQ